MLQDQEKAKPRKSDAQKAYEEADNAGRFAGEDSDAKAARGQAEENIRQDTRSTREERNKQQESDYSDAEARRDPTHVQDYKGEAQNVNDDTGRPLSDEEAAKASNKATEGMKQGRDAANS